MAFGAGVLVSAAAFELTDEALRAGGRDATAIGLAAAGRAFFGADWLVDRFGGEHRKRSGSQQQGARRARS